MEDGSEQTAKKLPDSFKQSARNLKDGLRDWIRVNKERENKLTQAVVKCDDIRENASDCNARMAEAARIQTLTRESIDRTNQSLTQQTRELAGLKGTVDDISARMKAIKDLSPWTPPTSLMWTCFFCCLAFLGIFVTLYCLDHYNVDVGDLLGWKHSLEYIQKYDTVTESDALLQEVQHDLDDAGVSDKVQADFLNRH